MKTCFQGKIVRRMLAIGIAGCAAFLTFSLLPRTDISARSRQPRHCIQRTIGGTDFDDFQSMVHLLVYADAVEIEGLIAFTVGASPETGRKTSSRLSNHYETDYPNLKNLFKNFIRRAGTSARIDKAGRHRFPPISVVGGKPTERLGLDHPLRQGKTIRDRLWLPRSGAASMTSPRHFTTTLPIKSKLTSTSSAGPQ